MIETHPSSPVFGGLGAYTFPAVISLLGSSALSRSWTLLCCHPYGDSHHPICGQALDTPQLTLLLLRQPRDNWGLGPCESFLLPIVPSHSPPACFSACLSSCSRDHTPSVMESEHHSEAVLPKMCSQEHQHCHPL